MNLSMPLKLTPARAWRTYIGGSRIDAIHGITGSGDSQFPEEWIISTVVARNSGREAYADEGLSFLEGQDLSLRDLIRRRPQEMLGDGHRRRFGDTTGVLVKIIDAGERLTIQAHPDKKTARRLFGSEFGKTECWHILDGREIGGEAPCVYIGFKPGITREYWRKVFDEQDIPAMLSCLHRFDVRAGETYIINGQIPHAIGAGCLLIEIQEPTDYTVRTERVTPAGLRISDFMCHQGLGFENMFDCFDYGGISRKEALEKWRIPGKTLCKTSEYSVCELIGYGETPCFRLERYDVAGQCTVEKSGIFSGLYVISGAGLLRCGDAEQTLAAGDQFFVPAECGPFTLRAAGEQSLSLFRCRGPQASAG